MKCMMPTNGEIIDWVNKVYKDDLSRTCEPLVNMTCECVIFDTSFFLYLEL